MLELNRRQSLEWTNLCPNMAVVTATGAVVGRRVRLLVLAAMLCLHMAVKMFVTRVSS